MNRADYASPLGNLALFTSDGCLTGVYFADQAHCPPAPRHSSQDTSRATAQARAWLDEYFAGEIPTWTPPVRLNGTPFQLAVWEVLKNIPYASTTTYGEVARALGTRAFQAVGTAIGRNPVSIIIPCHRVVASDGTPGGYAGGVDRKQRLLNFEKATALNRQ